MYNVNRASGSVLM